MRQKECRPQSIVRVSSTNTNPIGASLTTGSPHSGNFQAGALFHSGGAEASGVGLAVTVGSSIVSMVVMLLGSKAVENSNDRPNQTERACCERVEIFRLEQMAQGTLRCAGTQDDIY